MSKGSALWYHVISISIIIYSSLYHSWYARSTIISSMISWNDIPELTWHLHINHFTTLWGLLSVGRQPVCMLCMYHIHVILSVKHLWGLEELYKTIILLLLRQNQMRKVKINLIADRERKYIKNEDLGDEKRWALFLYSGMFYSTLFSLVAGQNAEPRCPLGA